MKCLFSVRTDIAFAPFFSYVAAIVTGSKSARISPLDGDALLPLCCYGLGAQARSKEVAGTASPAFNSFKGSRNFIYYDVSDHFGRSLKPEAVRVSGECSQAIQFASAVPESIDSRQV
jgi:hypothetical protein